MRPKTLLAALVAALVPTTFVHAQAIIAQTSGLTNPDHTIDFGAGLYPNFTNITTEFAGITVTHARYFTTGTFNNLVGGFLTNDFSGPPDTLTIKFATPIKDLSFVYQQIGTSSPSNFRAMLGNVVVDSFSDLSNQYQSNNYFGFTNILFDELQLDFVSDFNVDTLAFNDPLPPLQTYCTAGTSTNGCVPAIGASGTPSAAATQGFTISITNLEGQQSGLIFYGVNGRVATPWGTSSSLFCVRIPLARMGVQSTGGTSGACNGTLSTDFLAFVAANPGSLGAPFDAGDVVNAQGWYRDPPSPKATMLSDGLEFALVP